MQDTFTPHTTQYNRAKAKFLTNNLIFHLVDITDSVLTKSYWNTYRCNNSVSITKKKVFAKYCKNRFCIVCARNRSAKYIKEYLPILDTWTDSHFLTLTIQNIEFAELQIIIAEMEREFSRFFKVLITRAKRAGLEAPKAVLKLECTFNPELNNYHPHFHAILNSRSLGDDIIANWITHFKNRASLLGQDLKKGDENAVFELFKYFTKIITSKDKERGIYIDSLDKIFTVVKGKRTFKSYGFKLSKEIEDTEEENAEDILSTDVLSKLDEISQFIWDQETADWINSETGELLTGHIPSETLVKLVSNIKTGVIGENIPNNSEEGFKTP
jgi:hypothetical protein